MINFFKGFVISLLSLGIIVSFLELILPNGNMKKFVKVFISFFVLLTILMPFMKVDIKKKVLNGVNSTLDNFVVSAGSFNNTSEDLVKEEFLKRLKNDIFDKLKRKSVSVKNIYIILDDKYNISKLKIVLVKENDAFNISDILKYIEETYGISIANIEVVKEG